MPTPSESERTEPFDVIEDLTFRCLEAIEDGGETALDDFLRAHSEHADELRERIRALRQSGLVEDGTGGIPERLGDFRILERLGEGGMGIVYRAEQVSLGREVALKLIRPEQLYFGEARERFQREVETVASLHHPGIVAVHAVGEELGVPYFAMELVRGRSVDSILSDLDGREFSTLRGSDLHPSGEGRSYLFAGSWERACLRVIRQVCEALQFAHEQGVLHRDLKPSNLMITTEGTARALLLDFGLSRDTKSGKLTRTGVQLGSLRYMAPEQVRGEVEAIGPATDVYGLGVTLYEMLTLTPAFSGSQTEVALAVTMRGLPPLRTRNPLASWEVETILAKATDAEPSRRYASAADLARDLANVLENRPIEARRASTWLRLRRWAQRNPSRATAAAMGVVLLVGAPTGYGWQQRRAARAIATQRDAAVRAFRGAMDAIDQMLSRVGGSDLAYLPAMERLRQRLLEDAIVLLERVVAEADLHLSREGKLQLAEARLRLGRLIGQLGHSQRAIPEYEEARGILEALFTGAAADEIEMGLYAMVVTEEAAMQHEGSDFERALELQERLAAELAPHSARSGLIGATARNRAEMARTLAALGRDEAALAAFESSCPTLYELAQIEDTVDEAARTNALLSAATSWFRFGSFRLARSSSTVEDSTFSTLERCLELARALTEHDPAPQHQMMICATLVNLSGAHRRMAEYDEATAQLAEARTLLEALVRDHPNTLSFELELAAVLNQIGLVHDEQRRVSESLPFFEACAKHLANAAAAAPDEAFYQYRHALALHNVEAILEKLQRDPTEREEVLLPAIDAARRSVELAPTSAEYRQLALDLYSILASVCVLQEDYPRSLEVSDQMLEAMPDAAEAWRRAADQYAAACGLARVDEWLGEQEREEAAAHYAERACELIAGALERGAVYPDLRRRFGLQALRGFPAFEALCEQEESKDGESAAPDRE